MTRVTKETGKENTPKEEDDLEHTELRAYELGFHIDTELPKQKVKDLFQNLKKSIEDVGTVISVGEPHRITLAYTISLMEHSGRHDFSTSFFGWIAYDANGPAHIKIMEMVKERSDIFRYIDIRTTKEEAQHAATQHEERYRHESKESVSNEEIVEKVRPTEYPKEQEEQTKESKEKLDVAIANAIT